MPNGDAMRVQQWFARHGARFGLAGSGVMCLPVYSLGGFVNRSFHVHDGRRHLHVKLLDGWRWAEVHRHLERHYHAPRLFAAIQGGVIAGEGLALIFEHIPGRSLDPRHDLHATRAVLGAVKALHADAVLRAAMGPCPPRTCADELVGTYVDRFHADLEIILAGLQRLPFVGPWFPAWAAAEVADLAARASTDPAFAVPATAVIHGDLHGANVLLGAPGEWWLLDWDDLHAGGDPALDVFVLLWPLLRFGQGLDLARLQGPEIIDRLPLYRRAMLLDEVVDTVADWLEADALPDHRDMLRRLKQTQHAEALTDYRRDYGGTPG